MDRNDHPDLVFELLTDRVVAFHPILARIAGSVTAGLMLAQILYWAKRTLNPEGWFYKSRDEWTEETTLSRCEQETARRELRRRDFLQETYRGIPKKVYFRVNVQRVCQAVSAWITNNSGAANSWARKSPSCLRQTVGPETGHTEGRKIADSEVRNSPSITESTAEISSESTTDERSDKRCACPPPGEGDEPLTVSEHDREWLAWVNDPDTLVGERLARLSPEEVELEWQRIESNPW